MSPFGVRAPGKVVLVGEYAVLDGAPAVVAAIDRGVCCEVRPADRVLVEAPGDDRFVRAALAQAPPGRYRFSAWNPVDLPSKPGLGGSAAATVAAVLAAERARGGELETGALQRRAAAIHARVQGSGSGVDVAASTWGGLIRFRAGAVTRLEPVEPVIVWSGRSARTGPRVERYLRWPQRADFVARSAAIADAFAADPVQGLREATALLDQMTARAGIDWWTEGLRCIERLAARHGGAAKPSGAGGGDVAVALFDEAGAARDFARACAQEGLPVIPARLAAGAAVHR